MAQAAVSTLLVLAVASGCKRRSIAVGGEEAPPAAETVPNKTPAPSAPAPTASESHFLDPLIGAPWLGHADDGALVRVEFFISSDRGSALCRTNIDHAFGGAPTAKSPFTATADLAHIMWDDGNSRASFDPATQTVTARVASNARVHQVALRQTSVTTNPELATFRSSVPLDEHTKAEHQKFTATLESGNRWWKSIDGWDKLVTPQDIVADDTSVALIRPGDKKQPKLPGMEPDGHFNIPIECRLPPGSALADADCTVGVVSELHHSGDVQATWVLDLLNPGAITQALQAHWLIRPGERVPTGPATLYVYLAKSLPGGEVGTNYTDIAKPISNLLQIEIEIGPPAKPETPE